MDQYHNDNIPLTSREKHGANVSISHSISPPPPPSIRSKMSHRSQNSLTPRHHFWKKPSASNVITLLLDIVFALIPCLFIILAISALAVNNKPYKSGNSSRVYEAARVAPTLFPIVFAAVVGRLMRNFALWRAERGEKLGLIEQLHGSQNLVSALERAYLLPGLGMASIAVVLLWLTSPLGGQSSSRVLRPDGRANATAGTADVYYYNTSAIVQISGLSGSMNSALAAYSMNGVLTASLLSILQVKGQDLWGNVKIPFLESARAYSQNELTKGWYDTVGFGETKSDGTKAENDTLFSAMTGVITGMTDSNVISNFTMQSTYYNMTCEKPVILNDSDAFAQWAGPLYYHTNVSEFFGEVDATDNKFGRTFMIDTNWAPVTSNDSSTYDTPLGTADTPFNFIYASRWVGEQVTAFNCNVGYTHLELNIMNDALGSHVRGVRPTTTPEIYADWLPFWSVSTAFTYVQGLIIWMESAIPLTMLAGYQVSPIDIYISGSDTPFAYVSPTDPNVDTSVFPTSDPEIVARRFASVINTGWQTSFLTGSVTKSPSTNETLWADATAPDFLGDSSNLGFNAIQATALTETQARLNSVNMVWVILTIALSCLLLVCAVLSLFIKYRTHTPDVLGFVSSMTRDNPNFEKVPGSDQMDGLGYAKKLSNVRVQLEVKNTTVWDGHEGEEETHITLRNLGHAR